MKNRQKLFHLTLTILLSIGFALPGVLVFPASWLRFGESCLDLWHSLGLYFCTLLGLEHDIPPTVTDPSGVLVWEGSFSDFRAEAEAFFSRLFDPDNLRGYWGKAGLFLLDLSKVLTLLLPGLLLLFFGFRQMYRSANTDHGRDTRPLKIFKAAAKFAGPCREALSGYLGFLRRRPWIPVLWLAVWGFHLNLAGIPVSALAYYFYFVTVFDLSSLWGQVLKLAIDLQVFFRALPWWSLLPLGWLVFDRARKKIALERLRRFEARNCGFVNELPIVTMACGPMGSKKTTLLTDMALSQEVIFRQKALDILQSCGLKFPRFPWILFEDELRACMEHGAVFNLASARDWVELKRKRFDRHRSADLQLYGYAPGRAGMAFDDALKEDGLFDVLKTYAQAYFIYVMQSSLIVANFSVRTDHELLDAGNFPLWILDFFPRQRRPQSRHAHILDFDVLRLGRKVREHNPLAGSFEFGVLAITEIGKERGNALELKDIKKNAPETNQKNDLFNSWLKLCRHSATVEHVPFIKVFTDEQRPESWGADARDLCDILYLLPSGEPRLALPFYALEEMISEKLVSAFLRFYTDLRFRRGDNTLLVRLLKGGAARLWRRNLRIRNRYGYSVLRIDRESGRMDGKKQKKKYFLMNAKIYARRFSTDCFSDYFHDLARSCRTGIRDYPEYASERAAVEELRRQNSYFIRDLYSRSSDGEEERSAQKPE